jgi:transposase
MILDLHRQGLSISAISRRLGLDRKTVRHVIARGLEPPTYGPRASKPGLLTPFEAYLRERLAAWPELTGQRLLREIREQGYQGGYSTVKNFLRPLRPARNEGFEVRFETPPGRQAQVDFAHFRLRFSDMPEVERVVWLFSLVLGHSRFLWGRFVSHQDLQTVLRCHGEAFAALGGVPAEILYDRMKTVVNGEAEEGIANNKTLLAFASHHGFLPKACKPYRAQTKGKVERPFRYVREDFFLAGTFRNLDDLNTQFDGWRDGVANVRRHATTGRIVAEHFAEERPLLQPLPAGPFAAVLTMERRITRDGMVSVGGNLYSVPDGTRRREVEVHGLASRIEIFEDGRLIACHPLAEGRGQRILDAGHRSRRPAPDTRQAETEPAIRRAGEQVAGRPLAFYDAVADRLAQAGDQP